MKIPLIPSLGSFALLWRVFLFAAIALSVAVRAQAQAPDTLEYSIAAPPVGAQSGAQLGYSVAVDGNYTVVGAPLDSFQGSGAGVVKVFDTNTGALLYVIPNPNPGESVHFGWSVGISGTRVVVGVPDDYTPATGMSDVGRAHVYDLSSGTPTVPVATLNNPDPATGDLFGNSVAISGTLVVVGAPAGPLLSPPSDPGGVGSAYVYDLSSGTPTVPVATLNNPDLPTEGDHFGWSVSISGTRVVVGAHDDDTGGTNAGSAYVYDLNSGTPTVPVAKLNNPGPAAGDRFGISVSISGTRLVVGAYLDDTGADDSGSAYVYDLSSGTPTVPVATLNNPAPNLADHFGWSVAISGTRVVVGAHDDDTGTSSAGSAYVYDLNSATPTAPMETLNNPDNPDPAAGNDLFGWSVAIDDTLVVVGARVDDKGAPNAGSAYVYDLNSGTPTVPVATLNDPGPSSGDQFGNSAAISGPLVVVGAPFDDTGASDAGSAYAYDLNSGTPTVPVATLNNPSPASGDQFGNSVAISGTLVVVGAPFDDTGGGNAGSAYVYDLNSGTPTVPVATLNNPAPGTVDFGFSVSISGTLVVVGAPRDGPTGGSAYVYDLSSGTPTVPVATLKHPDPAFGDDFGFSVSISGTRVVVGAPLDDPARTSTGSAYIYELNSGTPTVPVATLNNPGPVPGSAGDRFGWAVSISGTLVVVGAPFNNTDDVFTHDIGSAYVYDLGSEMPTVPVATLDNPNPAQGDLFGWAVAIDGTRVVIGAYPDDTAAHDAGSAYVYDLSSFTPTMPVATLDNPSPGGGDYFGWSVAIDGTRAAIGAPLDDSGPADKGSVYVYTARNATVTVAVSPASVAENGGTNLVYTFTRAGDTTGGLTVNFTVGGTADSSNDYTQTGAASFTPPNGSVTFAAGSSTATVTIDPTADSTGELDETVSLTVAAGTGYYASTPGSATGTIANDDAQVSPTPTPTVTPTATPTPSPTPSPSPTAAQSLNSSTRLRVETGDKVLIGGFIIQGNASKPVLIRGLGPSLGAFGIDDVLLDPVLELRGPGGLIMTNDNWKDSPQRAQFEGGVFQPADDREAVVVATLPPENYTAILSGVGGTSGVGLVEIYDRNQAADAELANISTRGFVQTGENVMIGGFILGGGTSNTDVAVRGIGPSLVNFGVSDFLADPTLELRNQNGTLLIANDDWNDDSVSAARLTAVGLAPQHPDESAIFTSLPPGQFTAILAGKDGGMGIGLVEIYNLR